MKKMLLVLFVTANSFAQSSYKVDGAGIVWQHIYETNESELIIKQLKSAKETANLTFEDGLIYGVTDFYNDDKSLYTNSMRYYLKVDVKNNKYRVTISDIAFKGGETTYGTQNLAFSKREHYELNKWYLNKKGAIKKNKIGFLDKLSDNFKNKYKINKTKNEEW